MNRQEETGTASDDMDAFLEVFWDDGGESGTGQGLGTFLVDSVRGGQFSIDFCSFQCLRRLLKEWIDQTEEEVAAVKREYAQGQE